MRAPADLPAIQIRLLRSEDSLDELTALLHRAYAELGALGFNYVAVDQDVATTRRRIGDNDCFVAVMDSRLVGTALLIPLGHAGQECEWYRGNVAVIGQFATEPSLQRQGVGGRLMDVAERRAAELGATEVAVDTAEGATHLVTLYERRGYRLVDHVRWPHASYRSVILSKRLAPGR